MTRKIIKSLVYQIFGVSEKSLQSHYSIFTLPKCLQEIELHTRFKLDKYCKLGNCLRTIMSGHVITNLIHYFRVLYIVKKNYYKNNYKSF